MGNALAIAVLATLFSLTVRAVRRFQQQRIHLQPMRMEMLARSQMLLEAHALPSELEQRLTYYMNTAFPRPVLMLRALWCLPVVVRDLKAGRLRADAVAGQPAKVRSQFAAIRDLHDRLLAGNHPFLYRLLLATVMVCQHRADMETSGPVRSTNRAVLDEAACCAVW